MFIKILIKIFLLFILLSYSEVSSNVVPRNINDNNGKNIVIQQLFGMLRNVIKSGSLEADVPVLDPYVFDSKHFNLLGNYISLKANITNGVFSGLGNFHVQSYEFDTNDISLELGIRIPDLTFEAEYYELQGDILEAVPIYGRGRLHIKVYNLIFFCKIYLKQSKDGKAILIDNFEDPNYDIERIESGNQYDNNIDDIFNAMVEDLLAVYINRFSKFICMTYIDAVQQNFNHFLSKFATWDILDIIL